MNIYFQNFNLHNSYQRHKNFHPRIKLRWMNQKTLSRVYFRWQWWFHRRFVAKVLQRSSLSLRQYYFCGWYLFCFRLVGISVPFKCNVYRCLGHGMSSPPGELGSILDVVFILDNLFRTVTVFFLSFPLFFNHTCNVIFIKKGL